MLYQYVYSILLARFKIGDQFSSINSIERICGLKLYQIKLIGLNRIGFIALIDCYIAS